MSNLSQELSFKCVGVVSLHCIYLFAAENSRSASKSSDNALVFSIIAAVIVLLLIVLLLAMLYRRRKRRERELGTGDHYSNMTDPAAAQTPNNAATATATAVVQQPTTINPGIAAVSNPMYVTYTNEYEPTDNGKVAFAAALGDDENIYSDVSDEETKESQYANYNPPPGAAAAAAAGGKESPDIEFYPVKFKETDI